MVAPSTDEILFIVLVVMAFLLVFIGIFSLWLRRTRRGYENDMACQMRQQEQCLYHIQMLNQLQPPQRAYVHEQGYYAADLSAKQEEAQQESHRHRYTEPTQ